MKLRFPTKEILIQMVLREEEIRWSSQYLEQCDKVKDEVNGWIRISENYQHQIVREFGFDIGAEADIAVNHLRRARYLYPEEPKFQTIPVYVRNNRASQCKYIPGSLVPNVKLSNVVLNQTDYHMIDLYTILSRTKTNIVIGSSHT